MKDKIAHILLEEGITASKFADIVGVQPSGISHILSGRNKPGYDLIIKIMRHFPHLNPDWLLLGQGDMYREGMDRSVRYPEHQDPTLFDSRRTEQMPQKQTLLAANDDNDRLQAQYNSSSPRQSMAADSGENEDIEGGLTGFTLEGRGEISEKAKLARITDAMGAGSGSKANSKEEHDVTIERVMIFYSDNTVDTYKLKK